MRMVWLLIQNKPKLDDVVRLRVVNSEVLGSWSEGHAQQQNIWVNACASD